MASFQVLCFLSLAAFLGCLGLFALAVTKVVAPDGQGHARSAAGGFAAMLALFLLCGLGMVGLAATVAAIGVGSVAEWNPIRRIEVARTHHDGGHESAERTWSSGWKHDDDDDEDHDDDHHEHESAVSARFTVRGDAGGELIELLRNVVDVDLAELGDGLTIQQRAGADGSEFSVYEFHLPISEKELERFERDIDHELEGLRLRLPERVDIEFEGAERY